MLSRRLSSSFQSGDESEDSPANEPMLSGSVYKNLAKKQRDIEAATFQYRNQRQTIMCSASIPQRQHFAQICFKNGWSETLPELIHVSPAELLPPQVIHETIECDADHRLACMKHILLKELKASEEAYSNYKSSSSSTPSSFGKDEGVQGESLNSPSPTSTTNQSDVDNGDDDDYGDYDDDVKSRFGLYQDSGPGPFQAVVFVDTPDDSAALVQALQAPIQAALAHTLPTSKTMTSAASSSSLTSFDDNYRSAREECSIVEPLDETMHLEQRADAVRAFR